MPGLTANNMQNPFNSMSMTNPSGWTFGGAGLQNQVANQPTTTSNAQQPYGAFGQMSNSSGMTLPVGFDPGYNMMQGAGTWYGGMSAFGGRNGEMNNLLRGWTPITEVPQWSPNMNVPGAITQAPGNPLMQNANYDQLRQSSLDMARRDLDPYFQQQEADFRQRMANQGIAEGSEAYDNAFANMSRAQNDAYNSAAFNAQNYALGAQNQFSNQNLANQQLNLAQQNQAYGQQMGSLGMYNQLGQQNFGNLEGQRQFDINAALGLNNQALGLFQHGLRPTTPTGNTLGSLHGMQMDRDRLLLQAMLGFQGGGANWQSLLW